MRTWFGSVNTIQVDLFILPRAVADIRRFLGKEVPDVSIPVQETAGGVGTEAGLVRVQRDGVGGVQAAQLDVEMRT